MAAEPGSVDGGATFYFLNDLIGARVTAGGQKVGKLADLVAGTSAPVPAVTHIVVGRPFGTPTLYVPWPDVASFSGEEFTLSKSALEAYLPEPSGGAILLKDYVEDKKVLDIANREVEIVYDIRLTLRGGRLFLSDVDLNPRRFGAGLRRWLHGRDRATAVGGPRLVSWTLVQPLENLSSFSGDIHLRVLKERLAELPPMDLADVLEVMDQEERVQVFHALDNEKAAAVLDEIEPRVQREILAETSAERVEQIFAHLSPAEIADIIAILPRDGSRHILEALKGDIAPKVHQILAEYEVPVAAIAVHRLLLLPGDLTVEEAFKRFRLQAPFCDVTMYVYVTGPDHELRGVVDINELLQADPRSRLEQIMTRTVVTLSPSSLRDEAEALFRKYHFRAIPIVDHSRHVVGAVREKDAFLRQLPA